MTQGPEDADEQRALHYQLIARLLAAPPDAALLDVVADLAGDDSDLGTAVAELARRAGAADAAAVTEEYNNLFVGLGRGELLPFGSYYLTGFLHEKPLAKLRQDMARLGIERADEVKEPEDHIAALCEIMAGLILGDFGALASLDVQRQFFVAHLQPWAGQFFKDLERAQSARFYAPVGTIGRVLLAIEAEAFAMQN